MALAWERLLLVFLRKIAPEIVTIHFPFEWVFHQSAIISLENPQPGMVRNISRRLLALPWFGSARILLFVPVGTVPPDLSQAAWRIINEISSADDITHDGASRTVVIDATGCRSPRPRVGRSIETAALVERRWKEYMVP